MSILSAVQNEKWTQKIDFDMKIMPWHAMVKMVISIITEPIYSIYMYCCMHFPRMFSLVSKVQLNRTLLLSLKLGGICISQWFWVFCVNKILFRAKINF